VALPDGDPREAIDERVKGQAGLEGLGGQGVDEGSLGLEVLATVVVRLPERLPSSARSAAWIRALSSAIVSTSEVDFCDLWARLAGVMTKCPSTLLLGERRQSYVDPVRVRRPLGPPTFDPGLRRTGAIMMSEKVVHRITRLFPDRMGGCLGTCWQSSHLG
jgi:hypothetical protein